jgi:hypothetical protein
MSKKGKKGNNVYLVYDARARHMGTDEATLLDMCDTAEEAKVAAEEIGDGVVFRFLKLDNGELVEEDGPLN